MDKGSAGMKRFNWPMGGENLRQYLVGLPADEVFMVTVEPYKKRLPGNLQSRVSILIRELADFCGYSESQMKAIVKREYYPMEQVTLPGKEPGSDRSAVIIPKATMNLTPGEARALECHLYELGAQIGCPLSIPQSK